MKTTFICLTLLAVIISVHAKADAEANAEPFPAAKRSSADSASLGRVILRKQEKPAPKVKNCVGCKKHQRTKKCTPKHTSCDRTNCCNNNGGGNNDNGGGNSNNGSGSINNGSGSGGGTAIITPSSGQTQTAQSSVTTQSSSQSNASSQKNYCNTSCGTNNTGCNNSNTLKSTCPSDATIQTFSDSDKQLILDVHNDLRNYIANGSLANFDRATRMAKLVWDDDLAYLASLVTDTCVFEHDQCRATDKFNSPGQNLGEESSSPNAPNTQDAIRGRIQSWFDENRDASMSDIRSFSSTNGANGNEIGHFTQVVWANAIAVGCGATRFTKNGLSNIFIGCNYATGNIIGQSVYESGTSGSGCTTGTDSTYMALCTVNEPINPNQ